jgi:hypothetical protein
VDVHLGDRRDETRERPPPALHVQTQLASQLDDGLGDRLGDRAVDESPSTASASSPLLEPYKIEKASTTIGLDEVDTARTRSRRPSAAEKQLRARSRAGRRKAMRVRVHPSHPAASRLGGGDELSDDAVAWTVLRASQGRCRSTSLR